MEPSFWDNAGTWILIYTWPFLAFALGVAVSIVLNLNGQVSPKHAICMAIPVAFFTIGNLLTAMSFVVVDPVTSTEIQQYGHLKSPGHFLVFIGTVMLYGTLVPQLFNQIRAKVSAPDSENSTDPRASSDASR